MANAKESAYYLALIQRCGELFEERRRRGSNMDKTYQANYIGDLELDSICREAVKHLFVNKDATPQN